MSEAAIDTGTIETGDAGSEGTPEPTTLTTSEPSGFQAQLGGLDETLRADPSFKNLKSFEDMATQFVHAQSLIGKKGIMPPAEDDLADLNRYFSELGRPESPDKYDLGEWAPPEGLPWDETLQSEMLSEMHAVGLNDWQVQRIMAKYGDNQGSVFGELQNAAQNVHVEATSELKKEWGSTYENKVHMASRAMEHVFGAENAEGVIHMKLADGSELGNNVGFIKAMEKVGQMVGEDSLSAMDAANAAKYAYTPQSAQAEIDKLSGDSDFMDAFMEESHPGHGEALKRWERLHAFADPAKE